MKHKYIRLFEEVDELGEYGEFNNDQSIEIGVTDSSLEQAKSENPELIDANPEIEDVTAADINDFIEGNGLNFDELAEETEGMSPEEIVSYLEGNLLTEGFNSVKVIMLALAMLLSSCASTSNNKKSYKSHYRSGKLCSKMRGHLDYIKNESAYNEFSEISDATLAQAKQENPEFVEANPEIEEVSASDVTDFIADHGLNFDELARETEGMSPEEIADYLEGSAISEGLNLTKAIILSLAILLASCAGGRSGIYNSGHSKHGMSKDQKWQKRHRNIGGLPCGNSGGSSRPTQ